MNLGSKNKPQCKVHYTLTKLFVALKDDAQHFIPKPSWGDLDENDSLERRARDYMAGMTDAYVAQDFKEPLRL